MSFYIGQNYANKIFQKLIRSYCSPVFGTTVTSQRSLYSLQPGSKKGIMYVGDMTTEEGTTMTLESMRSIFNVNINTLHYFRIRKLIKSFTSEFKELQHPNFPFHLQILLRQKKGCKEFYNIFF